MLSTENYTVYRHTNKTNGKVYIGITRQAPERRWQKGAGYENTYFGNAIRKYGWDGFAHEIIASGLSKHDACETEKRLIKEYQSDDGTHGYNICEGGQTGDNLTPHYGSDNCRAVSVRRIDPKTGETKIYATNHEAAKELGINYRGISKACLGVSATYKGFIWEYVGREYLKPKKNPPGKYDHKHQKKKISVIDTDGSEHRFDSILDAGLYFGMRANTISRYVSGVRNDPTGRRWSLCL